VLIERNGPGAARAGACERTDSPAATIVGNVLVGAPAHVNHAAVIASGGPPVGAALS
jgi:hypothetical protein